MSRFSRSNKNAPSPHMVTYEDDKQREEYKETFCDALGIIGGTFVGGKRALDRTNTLKC